MIKFKHAVDFGVVGGYNRENARRFEAVLQALVAAPSTRIIVGTYRRNLQVVVYVDLEAGLAVITDREGVFVSGWALSEEQLDSILTRGTL